MYVGSDFDPSDVGESEIYGLDFAGEFAPGETIVGAEWSCIAAGDAAAPARLIGDPGISGTIVSQRVAGLVPGITYLLQCMATTNLGNSRSLFSHVSCQTPA